MWPDIGIKSSPKLSKFCQKIFGFTGQSKFFKVAEKATKNWATFLFPRTFTNHPIWSHWTANIEPKKRFTVSIPGRPFWGRWRWLWRRHVLRRAHDGRTEVGQPAPHPKASSQPRPLGVGEYNVWCFCEIFLLPPSAGNNAQINTWHKRNINKIIEWKKAYLIFLYVAYLNRLS